VLQDFTWQAYNELWWPAGALISSAEDMTQFMLFLLGRGSVDNQTLLREDLVKEMFKPAEIPGLDRIAATERIHDPRTDIVAYGLGWIAHEEFGRLIVEHTGAGRSSATVALMPEENLGVFVVSNASFGDNSQRLVSALKFAALEHHLGLAPSDWIGILGRGN
jgi:CubicO group peptidase (beta-lactamase class C family)